MWFCLWHITATETNVCISSMATDAYDFFFPPMAFKQLTSPAAVCDETPQEMNAKGTR